MTYECGPFSCLLKFRNECRCGGGFCEATSCAYPLVAKIKVNENIPAAIPLIALAENAEVVRTIAKQTAPEPKPHDMETLPKVSCRLFSGATFSHSYRIPKLLRG
jgi:hypothetical protein